MNNRLNIEEIRKLVGQDIWLISVNHTFGGRRNLTTIADNKLWFDIDSYLNIDDINVTMEVYAEKPDFYEDMKG